MKSNKITKTVYSALFAALIFMGTQFIQVPLPFGYFNLGDCFIILSALTVGGPYAIASAAIGSGLADLLSGYIVYAPATLIIKSVMAISVMRIIKIGSKSSQRLKLLFITFSAVIAELIMLCGYFIYDNILYGFAGALAALSGNMLQGVVSVITSVLIIAVFEHSGLMKLIKL